MAKSNDLLFFRPIEIRRSPRRSDASDNEEDENEEPGVGPKPLAGKYFKSIVFDQVAWGA